MIQINHSYSSPDLFKETLESRGVNLSDDKILVQVFTSILDLKTIEATLKEILGVTPNAAIIGATTDGEIIDGRMVENQTILSVSVFEKTTIKTSFAMGDDSFKVGKELAQNLSSNDLKCVICFVDGLKHNGDEFLKALNDNLDKDVVVAGGMSADYCNFAQTYVLVGEKVFDGGCVGVCLCGDSLEVRQDYNLGWRALGPKFTITKSEKNRVYEIDGKPIVDVYSDVLGKEVVDGLPLSATPFPLLIQNGDVSVARAMIAKLDDESVLFAGNVNEGVEVQFGIGSTSVVNQYNPSVKINTREIQASFIYSCSGRKRFLGKTMEPSLSKIDSLAPSSGFLPMESSFLQTSAVLC